MFDFLKNKKAPKKPDDDNIVILKQTRPLECGGTDAYLDKSAPKEIASEEMVLFNVSCSFFGVTDAAPGKPQIFFVSAFAAPCGEGTFLFLETDYGKQYPEDRESAYAVVKGDLMPTLVALAREENFAENNGYHSRTHGLPQNFGGEIDIEYKSGEKISVSDNQAPIIKKDTGRRIAELFIKAMKGEKLPPPPVDDIKEIRFEENREDGGFTKAILTLNADGTAVNKKQSRYDDPKVYESEKPVSAETVAAIKENIENSGILAWGSFPENGFSSGAVKYLTFTFADGSEITVPSDRKTPDKLHNAFFNIELELTTKN